MKYVLSQETQTPTPKTANADCWVKHFSYSLKVEVLFFIPPPHPQDSKNLIQPWSVIQREEKERFLRELQDSVECPVCFSIPRTPPVPCCQNGHVICTRCKEKVEVCPTCRIPMSNCVSQVTYRTHYILTPSTNEMKLTPC